MLRAPAVVRRFDRMDCRRVFEKLQTFVEAQTTVDDAAMAELSGWLRSDDSDFAALHSRLDTPAKSQACWAAWTTHIDKLQTLEDELQRHLGTLIESKQERWTQCQKSIMDHILDLGEFYSGSKVLSRDIKDEGLQKYFTTLSSHVKNLHPSKPTVTGRKIQQLVQALKDLEDFHQLSVSVQAKEYLKYIRKSLIQLTNIANISEFAMETLTVSSDLSYAWRLIDRMTPSLHRRISKKPSLTLGLRWLFLKLKSVLDIPLLRINECNSPDLLSVSEFWSNELVSYVKHVVEIIPVSIFEKLDEVFDLVSTFAYPHSYGGLSPASPANLFYDQLQRSYEPTALTDTT